MNIQGVDPVKHMRNLSKTVVAVEKASSSDPVDVQFIIEIINAIILKKTALLST